MFKIKYVCENKVIVINIFLCWKGFIIWSDVVINRGFIIYCNVGLFFVELMRSIVRVKILVFFGIRFFEDME